MDHLESTPSFSRSKPLAWLIEDSQEEAEEYVRILHTRLVCH